MHRVLALSLLVQTAAARGDSSVKVTLNEDGQLLADRLGISVPELIQRAHTKIEELFKVARLDELLRQFADTAAFSQRAAGVDYDPERGDVLVGLAAIGVRADVALGTTNTLLGSSILNMSAMAGLNLDRWKRPRWTVFANGFYEATTIRGLTGHLLTLGSHIQYRALAGGHSGRVRWTGVSATTGLEFARWRIGEATGTPIDSHFSAEGSLEGVVDRYTIHMSSTGRLDVTSTTLAMPIEATTGVRLFDRLVLYTGGGLGLTAGSSTIIARLESELSYTGDRIPVGTAVITGSGKSEPSTAMVHCLLGLAVHSRSLRLFVQGVFASDVTGVSLGGRAAF